MLSVHNSFTKTFPTNVFSTQFFDKNISNQCFRYTILLQKHLQPMLSVHNSFTKAFPAKAFVTSFLALFYNRQHASGTTEATINPSTLLQLHHGDFPQVRWFSNSMTYATSLLTSKIEKCLRTLAISCFRYCSRALLLPFEKPCIGPISEHDRQLLQENMQQNDRILVAAGLVMRNQFPEIPTPQPTLYAQVLDKLRPAEEGSLFYHNTGQCHSYHRVKCITMTAYKPSVSLQSCENSLLLSIVTLRMVQHCKSSSHRCKFREAARTVGALQSRSRFHFFWEMIQPP